MELDTKVEGEIKLAAQELFGFFESNGITQELNRTFFHPLGMELRFNDANEIEIWKTEDPKGYLLNRINPMYRQTFSRLSSRKHSGRNSKLGFCIQVRDVYRKENIQQADHLYLSPQRRKIEMLMMFLAEFTYAMYHKFIHAHKAKDDNISIEQFNYTILNDQLKQHLNNENWVDVANYAMILAYREKLQQKMIDIQEIVKRDQEDLEK